MVTYKAVNGGSLDADLTKVADAIRERAGTEDDLEFPSGFVSAVEAIPNYMVLLANRQLTEFSSEEVSGQLASSAFADQPNLVSVNIPNWTGGGGYAFQTCPKLTTVGCQSLRAIGAYCFSGCKALERIELPSLTYISGGAFNGCSALKTVIIGTENSTNIATLENINAFSGTPIASGEGSIYVRDNLYDSYTKAANWSTYSSQIKKLSTYTGN
jgi:hypothetical protein